MHIFWSQNVKNNEAKFEKMHGVIVKIGITQPFGNIKT